MKKTTVMAFLLALLAPIMSAWAGGTTTYYYAALKASVSSSGGGKVYASTSNSAPAASSYKADLSTSSNQSSTTKDESKNFYAFASADDGYEFSHWSTSNGGTSASTANPYTVGVKCSSTTESSPTMTTVYAVFKKKTLAAFNITFETSDAGTYTVDGKAPANKTGLTEATSVVLKSTDPNFLSWNVGGTTVSDNPYTATCLANTTISANFLTADQVTTATTYEELTAALANAQYVKITIPGGKEITVAKGTTLTVPSGKQLVVDGNLVVVGAVANSGTISGNGTLYKISYLISQGEVLTMKMADGTECGTIDSTYFKFKPKYRRTTVETAAPSANGTINCTQTWGVLLNGTTPYSITKQAPKALKVSFNTASAANEISSIVGNVDSITETANFVLLADCSLSGPKASNGRYNFTGRVDCAGKTLTVSGAAYDSNFYSTYLNGTVKFNGSSSNYFQNGKAAFFNCSSVTVQYCKNSGNLFYFYDCGTEASPASVSFSYYSKTRTTDYRTVYFYNGCYNYTFNSTDDGSGKCKVYGGSYKADPSSYLADIDKLEAKYNNSSKYYVVQEKKEVSSVALIGETPYETLAAAIAAAANGDTISLVEAVDLTGETVEIPAQKNITIALDKHAVFGGKIVNRGMLVLTDSDTGIGSAVTDASGATVASDIENHGTLDIIFGTYSGVIDNKVGTLTTHNGIFSGTLAKSGGTVNLRGGHFTADVTALATVEGTDTTTHGGKYSVCVVPDGTMRDTTVSGAAGYGATPYGSGDYALLKGWVGGKSSRTDYSAADWQRLAELLCFYQVFNNRGMDPTLVFDRDVANDSLNLNTNPNSGGLAKIRFDVAAGTPYRALTETVMSYGYYAKTYNALFSENISSVAVSVSDKSGDNKGTVCKAMIELWTEVRAPDYSSNGHKITNTVYVVGQKVFTIGAGSDKAMIRPATGAATFYATLGAAMDAAADGGTVMLANDCDTALPLNKAGTYTFDTMGFAASDAVSVSDGLFVKSETTVDSSAKVLVPDAKATTYVVAQKVASVGETFYDNLAAAVGAANGAVVTLYAATEETIWLTVEGQSFTLNKNGVAFDDAKVTTSVAGYSVKAEATQDGTLYTVVQIAVEDANGNSYATIGEAIAQTAGDTVEVTVTAPVVQEVEVPQGKTVTVTIPENVAATVTVEPAAGSFLVTETTTDANNNKTTTYEAKQITEVAEEITSATAANIKVEEVSAAGVTNAVEAVATIVETVNALMNNKALERADNTAKTDVLKEITVVPSAIVRVVDNNDKAVVKSAAFDVTPKDANGDKVTTGDAFTFRLPVDAAVEDGGTALVRHEGAFFGLAAIQAWSNYKFIEVTSSNFSEYSYEILDGETANPVAIIGTTGYATLAEAVAAANAGDTITMLADDTVSLTNGQEITIDKALTITGPVDASGAPLFTIYGKQSQTGTNDIFITGGGTVTLSNLNIEGFGCDAATDAGHAPIYVSTNFGGTVNLDNLCISKFNRGGVFLYGGQFNVTGCYIDCANSRSGAFTKGIEIKGSASGTISDTVIVNMERASDDSTAGIEIYGNGSVTVDGCTIISDDGSHESVRPTYGIVSSRVGVHDPSGGSLHVMDCYIDVSNAALSVADNDEYGPVNNYSIVVDGEDTYFGNYIATWSAGSSITINEGEFNEEVYADAGTITITGGTFNNFLPDTGAAGVISISGGIFDKEVPEAYCAEGYIQAVYDAETGLYTVKQGEYVAQVGATKYETLAEALANAANGDTVTLLDDVTLTEPLNVTLGDKAVTLDLGGKTLAGRTNLKSGNLTIQDGTVAGGSQQALNVYGSADTTAENYSVLTIASDVNVTADVYGVCMFGETAGSNGYGAVVNIAGNVTTTGDGKNGAVFVSGNLGKNVSGDMHNIVNVTGSVTSANDAAIAMNGSATVNVSGGATVTGNTAIAVKRGVLNVTGGTIRATGEKNYEAAAYANGTEMTGAAISLSDTYSQHGAMAVNVSGGTVTSDNADALFKKDGDYQADATIAVSAGSFSSAVPEEFCAAGYIPAEQDSVTGLYTVRTGTYVAQIVRGGSVVAKYEAFDAALADALNGDTVQLLADVTGVTTTYNIDKAVTIDGQGQYKIVAGENTSPRNVFTAWGDGGRSMFKLARSTANVTFENLTIDGGEGHYYTYFVHVKSGTATFADVELLRGGEADASGDAGVGYGAAILADGGNVLVSGSFYADTHGEALEAGEAGDRTVGIFPFTAILYQGQNGGIHFDDGTTADIGQDLLLVGMQRSIDLSDETAKAEVQAMLDAMNVPAGYVPYTLKVADSEQFTFTGASPLGWNDIIDYGKDIMDVSSSLGFEMDKTTTPVEVGLVADTVLPDEFTYEDANFTINGNGNTLSGTIEYTDNAGTMENVVMGTEEEPLVLDMTGLSEGNSINLGSGIAAENVTIKVTETQAATQGTTIVTWNAGEDGEEEAASLAAGVKVAIVDATTGEPVKDEQGEDKTASLMWDAELGIGYIGPCEARLTTVDANNETVYIYTSLARAIELARNSGDTVTLMMDIENFTGTQEIYKNLVLDGAGHKIAAKPVTTHRNVVSAFIGGTAMLKIEGPVTVRNITIDGDASHAYTYLISADNSNAALTTENVVLLHGGELCGDEDGNVLEAGAGYGAAIHLNNGASIIVKDGFYADTHGAPAEPGQKIEKSDGVFPFTGILPEGGSSVEFMLTDDTDAEPTVAIGEDLLLVGMVGAIDSETAQGILDYMKVPSRFRPYTLTLGDGSAYAFTGASLRTWNDIINYGKEIMVASTAVGYQGLDTDETPVEVGLLTDTELPGTFTYKDANFSVNGNGNALSGTIVFTDAADGGMLRDVELGTADAPLVIDLSQTTNPVDLGAGVTIGDVQVKMTEDQAALGTVVFNWDTDDVGDDDAPAHDGEGAALSVVVVDAQGEPTGDTKGVVWDDELGVAYIGPCEARLTGETHAAPLYTTLANAFDNAQDGDTVTVFWTGVSLGERVNLPAGELLFIKGKYDGITLGENAAFAFTSATTVFRSDMDLADAIVLAGDVADGYLLRTATDGTMNVYSVVQRGQYTVTGKTEDGATGTATIKASDAWVEAKLAKPMAEIKTVNEIEAYLDAANATVGMRNWEAYVLNQPSAPLRVTAVATAGNAVATTLGAPEAAETTLFTVEYSLDRVAANGTLVAAGARTAYENIAFAVPLDTLEGSAYWRIRAHMTSGGTTLVVDSANTIGALKVDSTAQETIAAVPWQGFGAAGEISVADFARTATLSEGDEIYVYDGAARCYRAWTLTAEKTWEPMQSVTQEGVTAGVDAAAAKIARGSAAWLKRAAPSAPLYLVGEAPMQATATPLEPAQTAGVDGLQKWNLVAPVSAAPFDLDSIAPVGEFDRIVVPTVGAPLNYTYKDGAWGYDGVKYVQRGGRTVAVPCRITDATTIPAGTGFWYLNSSTSPDAAIAW